MTTGPQVDGLAIGTTYTAIVTVWRDSASINVAVSAGDVTGAVATSTGKWETLRFTFVATATSMPVGVTRVSGYGRVYLGSAFVVLGVYTGASFDGFTQAVQDGTMNVWTGAPNASTSELRTLQYNGIPRTRPTLVLGYSTSWASNTVEHQILGSAEPSITLRETDTRAGELVLFYDNEATAWEAVALHRQMDVFEYSDSDRPNHAMRYVVTGGDISLELDDETRAHWTVKIPYREVR